MGGIVSSVGNLLGVNPSQGSGFQAQSANLTDPTTLAAINNAGAQNQGAIDTQTALVNALSAQNGIGNQSNVFNQLQGVANGTGPNPAMAQLNQATGQNVANQAALMAGQRGAGANVGLLARQAAQQGGALQQQAAGQGATLQANQSLNALGQLGGIAGQQVNQQQNAVQGLNQATAGEQNALLGANQGYNSAQVSNASQQNSANANIAANNAKNTSGALGGIFNAVGPAALTAFTGGAAAPIAAAAMGTGSNSADYKNLAKGGAVENPKVAEVPVKDRFSGAMQPHIAHMAAIYHPSFSKGGAVRAMVSPGEGYLPPEKAKAVAEGKANPIKEAAKVPGKAPVKGDSKKNDIVPAKLEEGGVVIPRSVMQSKDPASAAAKFVEAHLKKHGSGDEKEDFKSALKKAISNRKSA